MTEIDTRSRAGGDPDACVLVVNCGSSSLKLAAYSTADETLRMQALAERLETPEAVLAMTVDGEETTTPLAGASHADALERVMAGMGILRIHAIGHRVVHGGEEFCAAARVDARVIAAIERCSALAPLHNPASLTGIRVAERLMPGLPQAVVFDTAFHQTLAPEAYLYAVPRSLYQDFGVRRYGFHGTSHQYVASEAARLLGKPVEDTSVITLHLGNGCSACAVRGGRSVETTMGLTPGEGLVMGTRSGDVDPALHQYLQRRTGMDLDEITAMLLTKSGLLGLSGLTNDMRTLVAAAAGGDGRADLAIDVFCHRLAKAVGGLMASLESLDAIVFTGGIGENSTEVRTRTMRRLAIHGVRPDEARNASLPKSGGPVSAADSRLPCLVIPTREELMIARQTLALLA